MTRFDLENADTLIFNRVYSTMLDRPNTQDEPSTGLTSGDILEQFSKATWVASTPYIHGIACSLIRKPQVIYAVCRYIYDEGETYFGYYKTRELAKQALADLKSCRLQPCDAKYSIDEIEVKTTYGGELRDESTYW